MISGILRGRESDMRCFEHELHEVAAHRTDERLEGVFISLAINEYVESHYKIN